MKKEKHDKYFYADNKDLMCRLNRYIGLYFKDYIKIQLSNDKTWRTVISEKLIKNEKDSLQKEFEKLDIGQKKSGIERRIRNFNFITNELKELTDNVIITKKVIIVFEDIVKGLDSPKSNTGYAGITILKGRKNTLSIRLQVEKDSRRTSVTKHLNGIYSPEFLLKKFVDFKCSVSNINIPKTLNYTKMYATLEEYGYFENTFSYLDEDFYIPSHNTAKVINKRINKTIDNFIYSKINNTGYKHINVVDNGHGKPQLVLDIKYKKKVYRETKLINESNYINIVNKLFAKKMEILGRENNIELEYGKIYSTMKKIMNKD